MNNVYFLLSFIAACLINQAQAADINNSFAIKGAGIASCNKFLESVAKKDNVYYVYGGWIEGYITAQNNLQASTFDIAPWQSTGLLLKVVESICIKRPELKFHQVMSTVSAELLQQKLDLGNQFVNVGSSSQPILLQIEMVKRIQQALNSKGFDVGVVDGAYGEASRTAMKAFQTYRGLDVTGTPDQGALFELFKPEQK